MVAQIAIYGDSITFQGIDPGSDPDPAHGVGIYYVKAKGWQSWLRIATGSGFDFVPNGKNLSFSEPGKATPYLMTAYLPALLQSGAAAMIDQAGLNDVGQGIPLETTVSNCRSTWAQCRAAGILPMRMKVTPLTLLAAGNSTGDLSARIAGLNQALRAACLADQVPFLENNLETAPDNGIGDPKYFTPDPFPAGHPNALGGWKLGLDMAAKFLEIITPAHPGILNSNWLTSNTSFQGTTGGPPAGWQLIVPPATSISSQTLTPAADGQFWDLVFTDSAGSAGLSVANYSGNTSASAGQTMQLSLKFQVLSGAITRFDLGSGNIGGTGFGYALQMPPSEGYFPGYITPESGPVEIKGIPFAASAETTLVFPSLNFNATPGVPTTVRIWPGSFGIQTVTPTAGPSGLSISISRTAESGPVITFTGVLQSSTDLVSFSDVPAAASPYSPPAGAPSRLFFRARQP